MISDEKEYTKQKGDGSLGTGSKICKMKKYAGRSLLFPQVDLSATGDKLPNAVVAFLACEVS